MWQVRVAGLLGGSSVAAGAYGAHGLKVEEMYKTIWRTAVQYHRKVRRASRLVSELDGIPGVGPARRKALLTRFGSVQGVRSASVEELSQLSGVGPALAAAILETLGESTG